MNITVTIVNAAYYKQLLLNKVCINKYVCMYKSVITTNNFPHLFS